MHLPTGNLGLIVTLAVLPVGVVSLLGFSSQILAPTHIQTVGDYD